MTAEAHPAGRGKVAQSGAWHYAIRNHAGSTFWCFVE